MVMRVCRLCQQAKGAQKFAKNRGANWNGYCKRCNLKDCTRQCTTCCKPLVFCDDSNSFIGARQTPLKHFTNKKIITCDQCRFEIASKQQREEDACRNKQIHAKIHREICDIVPTSVPGETEYRVNLEDLMYKCQDDSLSIDEKKVMWSILQECKIDSKDKEHVESICDFLRQIPDSFYVGFDSLVFEYKSIQYFLTDIKEPMDKSIDYVFLWLRNERGFKPNKTQCTRWLSQYGTHTMHTVYTILCIQSICSKLYNGSVIKNISKTVMSYLGYHECTQKILSILEIYKKNQHNFKKILF